MTSHPEVKPEITPTYFAAVLNYYCHQNSLMWARVQTLGVIQIAALAAIQSLEGKLLVWGTSALCVLLTIGLLAILERDKQLRDANADLIQTLGPMFEVKADGVYIPPFRLGCPTEWPAPLAAINVFRLIFALFIVVDVLFAVFRAHLC